jgi:hypothetical protein
MKNIISFIIALLPAMLFAQTAERQVIGSTGGFATNANMQASYNVGEVAITNDTATTVILTQGFEQTEGGTVGIKDITTGLSVNAYPNPAKQAVTLDFTIEQPMELNVALEDVLGRTVLAPTPLNLTGNTKHSVSLMGLAAGQYLIHLSNADGTLNQTIQIQKVK